MKSFKKILTGAVSALALAGSMQAQAGTVDNISWVDGPLTINGGFGKSFWATGDVTTGGSLNTGGTLNMSDASIFRGAAFSSGGVASGTIGNGNWFFAWGEIASGLVADPGYRLTYMIKGQATNVSAAMVSGQAQEAGAFSSLEIVIFKSPTATAAVQCSNTTTPSTCQTSVDSANLNPGGTVFLDMVATLAPPANTQTISEFTMTNNIAGPNSSFLNAQTLSFKNSYFDVVGGTGVGYFGPSDSQPIQIGLTLLETDILNTSTGTIPSNPTNARVVGFNLILDTVPVPEPGSLALLGLSLVGLGLASRRRRA